MKEILKAKTDPFKTKDNGIVNFSVKDVDTANWTVCMVLNTYNFLDNDTDIFLMGCAKRSIDQRGPLSNAAGKIKHALFHDLTLLPGKIITLDEREIDGKKCLYAESKLSDTQEGNDTLTNYLDEIYDQHSIGFQYVKAEWVERDNQHGNSQKWDKLLQECVNPTDLEKTGRAYVVSEIKLFEGSTVAFGANSMTPAMGIKSANKDAALISYYSKMDKLAKALKNGKQSDEMMEIFELQILQLKQWIGEIFERFEIKEQKEDVNNPVLPIKSKYARLAELL